MRHVAYLLYGKEKTSAAQISSARIYSFLLMLIIVLVLLLALTFILWRWFLAKRSVASNLHDAAPAVVDTWPTGQAWHDEFELEPVSALYVPAGQLRHESQFALHL